MELITSWGQEAITTKVPAPTEDFFPAGILSEFSDFYNSNWF